MSIKQLLFPLIMCLPLFGCSAMGVPATSDPIKKLNQAVELFDRQGRPLPAELLILEATEICEKKKDNSCLGLAYLKYGFFFKSPSIEVWEKHYRKNGFYDKTATYENRYVKSKECFEKSISYYLKTSEYDALTNAYLHLGHAYYFSRTKSQGDWIEDRENLPVIEAQCESYVKSLEYYRKNLEENSDADVVIPKGTSSFKEFIAGYQKLAGCIK